jgi:hypothetical protein
VRTAGDVFEGVSDIWIRGTDAQRRISMRKQTEALARALRFEHPELVIRKPGHKPRRPRIVYPKPRDYLWLSSPSFPIRREKPETAVASPRDIIRDTAARHGMTVAEMISHRREKRLVRARWEAASRLAAETTLTLQQIGRKLGNRDHTTILYAIRKHRQIASGGATG